MKRSYLLIATIVLFFISCKKDKQVSGTPADTKKEDDYTICADDSWGGYYEFEGHIPSFIFVYNNKAYVPRDHGIGLPNDRRVYIFDGTTWTDIATNNPHVTDHTDASFTIGNKGYVIFSVGAQHARRFYEYNLTTNVWTRKADFPGEASGNSASFTIGSKGYIVGGDYFGTYTNETWEYNPATDSWRERASLFMSNSFGIGFSIGNRGYIANGKMPANLGYFTIMQEYNPATNDWTTKASFPGAGRIRSQAFVIGNNAYVGGGTNGPNTQVDFYKYSPSGDSWLRVDDIPPANYLHNSFSLNEKGYVVHNPGSNGKNLIRYNPKYCTTIQTGPVVNLNN